MNGESLRRFAVLFLSLEGLAGILWWTVLLAAPSARRAFLAPGAPDSTLLAFLVPDLALFSGGALGAAAGLVRRREWAWPVLCLHTGAAVYAALYCLSLPLVSGGGWVGAALMAPCLVVPPYLAWRLRPEVPRC